MAIPDPAALAKSDSSSVASFSPDDLHGLCDQLASTDRDLGEVLNRFGYPPFWNRENSFESLIWFILEQQISLAAAKAALEKLRDRIGTITPENLLQLDDTEMRAAYFSRQKTVYARALATEMIEERLDLQALEKASDDAARERLTQLKGIGNWTADVYLILTLHRSDVFPVGDLAAVNALKTVKGMPSTTTRDEVLQVAETWAPLRTIATMILWHDYLSRRGVKDAEVHP